jgi:hypothetical protein
MIFGLLWISSIVDQISALIHQAITQLLNLGGQDLWRASLKGNSGLNRGVEARQDPAASETIPSGAEELEAHD